MSGARVVGVFECTGCKNVVAGTVDGLCDKCHAGLDGRTRPLTDTEVVALAALVHGDAAATINDAAHAHALGERPVCEFQSAAYGRLDTELRRRGVL